MGILEDINAKLDALIAHAKAAPAAAAAPDPFGLPASANPAPAAVAVTDAQIMELITPHLANADTKAKLQAELAAMGIQGLPNAQPHQYSEVYQRFQRVIAAGAASASII